MSYNIEEGHVLYPIMSKIEEDNTTITNLRTLENHYQKSKEHVKKLQEEIDRQRDVIHELKNIVEGDEPSEDVEEDDDSPTVFETIITWGVNFRTEPNTDSIVIRMIEKDEKIHVIEQVNGSWLKVVDEKTSTTGYLSSKDKYTTYSNKSDEEKMMDSMFAIAETYLGCKYVFGAKIGQVQNGERVFDCSSFTKTVLDEAYGIYIPRISYDQATKGSPISRSNLKRGDLMFFSSESRGLKIGHVGIYAGDDRILHTYGTGGVRYTPFTGKTWDRRYVSARRMVE